MRLCPLMRLSPSAVMPLLFLPFVANGGAPATRPPNTPVPPSATSEPTESPMPTSEPSATPTAEADRTVLFQHGLYGGLTIDMGLSYIPSQTPRLTIYADGEYIAVRWAAPGPGQPWRRVRHTGRLSAPELRALVDRIVGEVHFFNLPADPPPMACITDQPTDYVYFSYGGEAHRTAVYGLSMFDPEHVCRERPEEGLMLLADLMAELDGPLADPETPYEIEGATVAVHGVDSVPGSTLPWPLPDVSLEAIAAQGWYGTAPLTAEQAREVDGRVPVDSTVAYFLEEGRAYLVGLRVEYEGWGTYLAPVP